MFHRQFLSAWKSIANGRGAQPGALDLLMPPSLSRSPAAPRVSLFTAVAGAGSVFSLLVSILAPLEARAQRGQGEATQTPPPKTPLTGFPGAFDTNLADPGSLVLDIPSLSVDYGLTENLTVGTNGWFALPVLVGSPAIFVKARYRFFSDDSFASAITGYGGFLHSSGEGEDGDVESSNGSLVMLSSTNTFYLSPETTLTAFLWFLQLGFAQGERGDVDYASAKISSTFFGLNLQHWFNDRVGPALLAFVGAQSSTEIDSAGLSVRASSGLSFLSQGAYFVRGLVEFRAGRWLFSPGLFTSGAPEEEPATGPFFSATVKF